MVESRERAGFRHGAGFIKITAVQDIHHLGFGERASLQGALTGGNVHGRGGGIDDMIDRFPNITPADLKPGDMIAFSSTKNGSVDRIKAIKLLAGVEPFLRMAQASNGSQRSQGVSGGFTIPGLDGVGF